MELFRNLLVNRLAPVATRVQQSGHFLVTETPQLKPDDQRALGSPRQSQLMPSAPLASLISLARSSFSTAQSNRWRGQATKWRQGLVGWLAVLALLGLSA